jgi:hypothetical protein
MQQDTIKTSTSLPDVDSTVERYHIYLKFPDTSKVARRRFNGVVRWASKAAYQWPEWTYDEDSEHDDGLDVGPSQEAEAFRGRIRFSSIILGNAIGHYFEDDFLEGCEPHALARVFERIPLARRAIRTRSLRSVACGLLLTSGAGGTGKSYQTGVAVALSSLQGKPVLAIANQHKAVDGIMFNIINTFISTGIQGPVIRTYDYRTDYDACLHVAEGGALETFKTRKNSKWQPKWSLAFWLSWLLNPEGVATPLLANTGLPRQTEVHQLQ